MSTSVPIKPSYVIRPMSTDHVTKAPCHIPINWEQVAKIERSGYEAPPSTEWDGTIKPSCIQATLRRIKKHKNCTKLRIQYDRVAADMQRSKEDRTDRAQAKESISAGDMQRELRAGLFFNKLRDFDQSASHQRLMLSALRTDPEVDVEVDYPNLLRYVNEKATARKEIAEFCEGDTEKAKKAVLAITFGGKTPFKSPFLVGYQREIASLMQKVVDANPDLHASMQRRVRDKTRKDVAAVMKKKSITRKEAEAQVKKRDWKASLFSLWCRNQESLVIEAVAGWCMDNGLIRNRHFDNSRDGLMIPCNDVDHFLATNNDHKTVQDILDTFRRVSIEKTGHDMWWEEKCMKAGHDAFWEKVNIELDYVSEDMGNATKDQPDAPFDAAYCAKLSTTEQRVEYFNRYFAWIENQHKAIHIQTIKKTTRDGTLVMERNLLFCSSSELRDSFGEIPSGQVNLFGKEIPLAVVWMTSPMRRKYRKIHNMPYAACYNPERAEEYSEDAFNAFVGYPSDVWEGNATHEELPEAEMHQEVAMYVQLLSHVLGCQCHENGRFPERLADYPSEDKAKIEFFLHVVGHRIVHPEQDRHPYYVTIQSACGVGKNTAIDPLERLVGSEHYICDSNVDTFFGTHAEGVVNKLFCVYNEASIADSGKHANKMKAATTEGSVTVNAKYQRPIEAQLRALFILLSNENIPCRIDPLNKERRVCTYRSSDWTANRWSSQLFGALRKKFKTTKFLRALRQFFQTLDYETFDYRTARKVLLRQRVYQELVQYFLPCEVLFLRDFIEQQNFDTDLRFRTPSEEGDTGPKFWEHSNWNTDVTMKARDMHGYAKTYYEEHHITGEKANRSDQDFNKRISALPGMNLIQDRTRLMQFNPRTVYKAMVDRNLVDYDTLETALKNNLDGQSSVKECAAEQGVGDFADLM